MARPVLRSFLAAVVIAVAPAALAGAQSAPAQAPAPKPEPAPPAFHGTVNAGAQLQGGVTEAWGVSLDSNVTRPYSRTGSFNGRGNIGYARVVVSDDPRTVLTQNDRMTFSGGIDQRLGGVWVFMARSLFLRDKLHEISWRLEELAGVGVHLVHPSGRMEFTFVPGLSALDEDTFLEDFREKGWKAGAGFYQRLAVKFDERWSFEDAVTFRENFKADDMSIEANAGLTGMVTRILGVQLQYSYVREDLVPPGVKPYHHTMQAGLQFRF